MKNNILRIILSITILLPGIVLAQENSIFIGLNVPLSGSYASQGEDELKAYKLAIKQVNQNGGILGQKIVYAIKDTKTNANTARENAIKFIKDRAIMITGGSSSAVAIAQSEECQKAGVIFMACLTHSNATTGKNGHRHTFRWYNNGHQTAKAMAKILVEKFGNQAKYAYLYADYTWGKTVQQSMQNVIEAAGCKTVLNNSTELGAKSFLSSLLKVKKVKPDVLVLVHFGGDMINCLKQVNKLKLTKSMKIVVPLMELHMAHGVGPEIMQGITTSMCWYHGLSEKYEGSKKFVELFEKEYGKKPGNAAAAAWVNIFQYADAVKRAGSFDHIKVIKAMEGHKFTLLGDEEYWREWDHQGIHPTYVAVGKSPAESKNEWDLFNIIASKPGNEVARTREENPVKLEALK
ncbi:Branched-chain amino acid ABC transporter, periplasmic substrate-binding protein [Candidatus Magnetomorum sp. HK-1]|nr:Branched-chain amino acid ABC transporter, periplasmic substrate-binding protein [Candidatus Magnetomorum sp. HK-1]